jgi:uncharacterized membrane protein YebE (DUF533 family)
MAGSDFLGRLFVMARNRDGHFRALEPQATMPEPLPKPVPVLVPDDAASVISDAVATKLLDGWLGNRSQTLVPHTLNFRVLTPEQASPLLAVMAAAAQADGRVDGSEVRQLPLALARVGAGEAEARELERLIGEPQPLLALLAQVQEAGLASHAYAAALLAINRRGRANRAFLDYLAARLGLGPEVAGSLERRYRA